MKVDIPDEMIDAIAERAAAIVLARHERPETPAAELMTVAEAADLLRCSRQRVYDLLSAGVLCRYKDGSRVLLRRADIVAYLGMPR